MGCFRGALGLGVAHGKSLSKRCPEVVGSGEGVEAFGDFVEGYAVSDPRVGVYSPVLDQSDYPREITGQGIARGEKVHLFSM